ncbi:MAG: serine/threonine-protein kinase [Pirellulales bacterium]
MANGGKNSGDYSRLFAEREKRDAAGDATTTNTPIPNANTVSTSSSSANVDATCLYEEDNSQKKERDVAFAVVALEAGAIGERQLAKAVKNWTIHGADSLANHLARERLLSEQQCDTLRSEADHRFKRAVAIMAAQGVNTHQSASTSLLAELDAGGRVTNLLGLGCAQTIDEAHRTRSVTTRYQLLRPIGQGGMGTVWLARDDELGRLVAIKEMRSGSADAEGALRRFRREAQVTGRLEHPSIVPVHHLGGDDNASSAFYVMRFLGKRTLEDAIVEYHERRESGDDNPMHLHRLLTAFVTVCQAIAFAHSRKVVHRDLKPENIALDDFGQVIVLDWGLAKLTGRAELQDIFGDLELEELGAVNQTTAGQVLGTPMYMAPEQAAGRLDEIEPATDVYGLGAILFAILTGFAPHEKSHTSLTSTSKVTELFQAIVSSEAPSALSLNPDAPPELDAVCAKAMANRRLRPLWLGTGTGRRGAALDGRRTGDDVHRALAPPGLALDGHASPTLAARRRAGHGADRGSRHSRHHPPTEPRRRTTGSFRRTQGRRR